MKMLFTLCLLMLVIENVNIMLHLKRSGVPKHGVAIPDDIFIDEEGGSVVGIYIAIAIHLFMTMMCVFLKENTNNHMLILLSVICFEVGMGLYIRAEKDMKASWRYGIYTDVDKLVKEGIYADTRNPALLGMTLMMLSITMISESVLGIITFAIYIMAQKAYILAEEDFLKERFKEEYEEYCKEVPKFFWKNLKR